MLHDVQRILGIGIEGSLPAEPSEGEWQVGITNLFGEPMSETVKDIHQWLRQCC